MNKSFMMNESTSISKLNDPFKRQSHKMVKHTQIIRRQIPNLTILWDWRLKGYISPDSIPAFTLSSNSKSNFCTVIIESGFLFGV